MTEPQPQPQSPDGESRDSRQVAAPLQGQPVNQPEYGQRVEPEYGARADEFPQGYDPYLYGHPDDGNAPGQVASQQAAVPALGGGQGYPGYAGSQPGQYPPAQQFGGPAQGGYPGFGQPQGPGNGGSQDGPHYFHGINLDDPQQNPIYGHWDFYAIFAFVFSILFAMPVLPALIGGLAIWRTRRFHTKGVGLAIAAVVINVLSTITVVWLMMHGISADEFYQMMMNMIQSGGTGGTGGSGDSTISA
ncbi:DUF4190 domain-containing protein [Bifidobacterium leontopitheci]|uniref:DUF4190 domain-containing protein n=1 Tax=Bifidobacterium leontopitheci TaxID=2650774 RepID=A0A6I1GGZ8_9BIFI|nr:DUF4190 domain-containing protein [Bifidobacterium leontopitheci]KAB7790930.1 hypothetical protein F7D09_0476 [Bifidobacterium leontopitheci]